jgi:hypothetical protein
MKLYDVLYSERCFTFEILAYDTLAFPNLKRRFLIIPNTCLGGMVTIKNRKL